MKFAMINFCKNLDTYIGFIKFNTLFYIRSQMSRGINIIMSGLIYKFENEITDHMVNYTHSS